MSELHDLYVWSEARYWDAMEYHRFPCLSCAHRDNKTECPACTHHTQNNTAAE